MDWLQITVSTTDACADVVSVLLTDFGSEGVSIADGSAVYEVLNGKKSWDYVDESLIAATPDEAKVSGFFPVDFNADELKDRLKKLREEFPFGTGSLEISEKIVADADWENEWRKFYEPIEIGKVAIVPAWIDYDGDCKVRVLMEPGKAFGTGQHETTAMCIELLQEIGADDKEVLDVGCGSGILGVTALKLGFKRCVMSDIDEDAVAFSVENARLNEVAERAEILCCDLTEKIVGEFDVVLANLTADILLRLKTAIHRFVKKGGFVIVSGLIHARADEVLDAFSEEFRLEKRLRKGEWQAMLLKKK